MVVLFLLYFLPFCLLSLVLCWKSKDDDEKATMATSQVMQQPVNPVADAIWTIKIEFDSVDPKADYQQRVMKDFDKIRRIYRGHQCKKGNCAVCQAYMEWAGDQYKQSYNYETLYPAKIREKLEEIFFYAVRRPLCVENPYWLEAKKNIKKGKKKERKEKMQQEKMAAKGMSSGQFQNGSAQESSKAETPKKPTSGKDLTISEQAAAIRRSTRDYIQRFNQNGKVGKPPMELYRRLPMKLKPEDEKKYSKMVVELFQAKKEYGNRVADDYERLYQMYDGHNCQHLKKKVSEEDACPVCGAFIEWAAEQYEESYRDWRYPVVIRQNIEKVFYSYSGKPPLCISNPYWPKAKDRMKRARPRWKIITGLDEEVSEAPGLLQGVDSISADIVDDRKNGEDREVTAETPSGRDISRETPSTAGSVGRSPVDQNLTIQNTQKTQKDGKLRMMTAESISRASMRRAGNLRTGSVESMETAEDQQNTCKSTRKLTTERTARMPDRAKETKIQGH